MRHGIHHLATDTALALAARYLKPPHRIGDALAFASGSIHLWSGWQKLPLPDRILVTEFIKLRPEAIAEDRFFLSCATETIDERHRFQWINHVFDDAFNSTFELAPGK